MATTNKTDQLLVKEVAQYCRVKERTVRNWYTKGGLNAHKAGGRILIHRDDLEKFIRAKKKK